MSLTYRNRSVYIVIIICFLLINVISIHGQSYYFDNYSVKEGLAQSTVYDVLQDSKGYLWIGTSAGVSRFDGIHFLNYTYENGLGRNAVQKIIEDKNGSLWFGHKGGDISRLKDDSLQSFNPDTVLADITSLAEDKDGNIWAGSFGMGALKIKNPNAGSLKNLDFIQYKGGEDNLSKIVLAIYENRDGLLYFIVKGGIRYFDFEEKIFKNYQPQELPAFYQFTCMFEDNQRNLWFGTDIGGLYKLNKDGSTNTFQVKDGLVNNWITAITEDKNQTIWIGTWGGGINTISNNGIATFTKKNGLPDLKIRCISNDFEGNVLIGTNKNGLCIFKGAGFINYGEKDGIRGKQINAIIQDNEENYWFGTDEGISKLSRNGLNFSDPVYYNVENQKIPENSIRFLQKDNNGTIWVAGEKSIVSKSKPAQTFDYNFLINGYIRNNNLITALAVDKFNSLWIGTLDGLFVYDIDEDVMSKFDSSTGLAGNTISALYVDSRDRVWIGCEQRGITLFDPKDTLFITIKEPIGYTPFCMVEAPDNTIWVGTQSLGILVFDDLILKNQYRSKDGLLSENITSLIAAINNNVYIGTSRGLNKYSLKDERFSSYSNKTGFTGIEVKKNAGFVDKDGNIWLGTVNGATRINLTANQDNLLEPMTLINRFRVNLKDRKISDDITLSYTENSIIIDYASICLTDPDAVIYKFMLQGAQQSWQPETKQTAVSYSGLSPGEYTFKLMAKNSAGIWNKEPVTISFKIKPPFWQTVIFWIIIIIIALSLVLVYIKIRERKLVSEKHLLEEKVKERTAEISQKNKELEVYTKNVTGSIKYAKRIQDAMLPAEEYLNRILPEHFILYQPKDIVSGDYYWAAKKGDMLIVAAVDCTGHGVPGAFMSMLGITLLDEIVNKKNVLGAARILDEMREAVIKSLKQKGMRGETQDGMDIALCSINVKTLEMQFAGAYNPMYIIRNNELLKFKANRMPIGIYYKNTGSFSNHIIQLQENDIIYLFSDGYIDQFNEYTGEKIMTKNFRNFLLKSCHLPMKKQHDYLLEKLNDWKGNIEQVDDVLIIGLRINFDHE